MTNEEFDEPGILSKECIEVENKLQKNPCTETNVHTGLDKKNRVINALAEERIKLNCDYAIASKFGEIHIISHQVYKERIEEIAAQFRLPITSFNTWDTRVKSIIPDYCKDCGHVYYNCLCTHEDL